MKDDPKARLPQVSNRMSRRLFGPSDCQFVSSSAHQIIGNNLYLFFSLLLVVFLDVVVVIFVVVVTRAVDC